MRNFLFTIMLVGGCILNIQAQDKRFEYTDSSLLIDSEQTGTHEYTADQENKDILSDTAVYINNIIISPDSLTAWKNNKRFAYVKNLDSLLTIKQQEDQAAYNKALKQRPNNFLQKLFSSGILQVFFWTVAIVFVVFILYKLFLSNGIFKRNAATAVISEAPAETFIATVSDYDGLIHQSVKLGDHRMAVRYLFLKTLTHLVDKEYLHHSADKTNYQYVQEIRADKKNEFASLVLTYEYIWYGNFTVGSGSYTGIEKKFNTFYNKIQ